MNLSPSGVHLLGTSAIILLMRRKMVASREALIPFAVLGELNVGVYRADSQERELAQIQSAIGSAQAVLPTQETAIHFGRITAHLQRIGQMIPANDV